MTFRNIGRNNPSPLQLVDKVHGPAFMEILNFLREYGIYHQVSNARMLWDDNAENPKIFDLGDDEELDSAQADDPRTVSERTFTRS